MKAFNEGYAKKVAKGFDIMAMHGVNPRTGLASELIGKNSFDTNTGVAVIEYDALKIEENIETAIAGVGEAYNVNGRVTDGIEYAMYIETDTLVLDDAEYATVIGNVTNSGSYVHLENTEIEYIGNDIPNEYVVAKVNYDDEQIAIAIAKRDQFIESAESVTYNDLRRYPDTYKDKPIKLTICFTTVDPDGLIFQGDMFANISGTSDELSIYDSREVREPRFMKGDTVTVYGTGNGLSTIKVKDGTGLFANVIDEYEIPSVKVLYTDLDKLDSITVTDPDNKYDEGREVGEKVYDALNKMLD